jgi:hypothetical protein
MTWPPSPLWLVNVNLPWVNFSWPDAGLSPPSIWSVCTSPWLWAWGRLWTFSPTNFVRIFVTPTLTWGLWTAICFWWPALLFWNIPPKWVSPLIPGWNCIVVAKKLSICDDDWYVWDPSSVGIPVYSWDGSFGVINWNCKSGTQEVKQEPSREQVASYLEESSNWIVSDLFEFLPWSFEKTPQNPLFTNNEWSDVSVSLDISSLANWSFEDIIKIQQKRVSAFPEWLMDWVTRQIEEIANKLTDFPTVYVILPDFWWLLNWDWWELAWKKDETKWDILNLDSEFIEDNEYIEDDTKEYLQEKVDEVNNFTQKSWIKEAYEFISSTPLITLEQETVHMTLPWISKAELNKAISNREATIEQREGELDRAKEEWDLSESNTEDHVNISAVVEFENLLNSLRQNLEVIKEYKKLPEKINKYLNAKEIYLEQILCNIETISNIMWWRIWKNGIRFKTWVELYILIKAILKSWQLLVDIFMDYKAECHECKNERQDAFDFEFSLIDMLMPKIPIIRFPKWPDLIIDLHNIRAWMVINLPEFNIWTKPILLPTLPDLHLPDVPNVNLGLNLNLPKLPVLPSIELPELPSIPSLPKINLPDLPPPPKLPKLLSALEFILNILKLIFKAMCLLNSSPLHPEWRAWDQISMITERSWFLWTDFFNLTLPEFSFPFLDAIKVTSYVNLEFEVDFLVEMARQVAMPINSFTNDFTNVFSIDPNALDFRNAIPQNIDVEINVWWEDAFNDNHEKLRMLFAQRVATNILRLVEYIKENKDEVVDNKKFKQLINKSLSSKSVTSDPKTDKLLKLWEHVNSMTYSKENTLINELQKNNRDKFDTLKDIVNTEIIKNKDLKKDIKNLWKNDVIIKVSSNNSSKDIDLYNKSLEKYNNKFIESAKKLMNSDWDSMKNSLKETKNRLINSIRTPLQEYSENNNSDKLLSWVVQETPVLAINSNTAGINSCQAQAGSDYRFEYEWLYVIEWNISYKLTDYTDEFYGNEVTKMIDIDNDNDEDLLYIANWQLFLKENSENNPTEIYVSTNPLVVEIENNKFYNSDKFYESINNFREIWSDSWSINLSFTAPTNSILTNFRIWFYSIVDKYLNEDNENYKPRFIKKDIVDAIAWVDNKTINEVNNLFIQRKNLVYINNVWSLAWTKLKTKQLINIKDDLLDNNIVNIVKGTRLYSWDSSFSIDYNQESTDISWSITISKNSNIELSENISITWLTWDAFILWFEDIIYEWENIRNYKGKPLFNSSKITYIWNNFETNSLSYIDLKYYDDSELWINFSETSSWELYDLWYEALDYYVRLNRNNDYYYAKINSFKNNIDSTSSEQILFAPQSYSDDIVPELYLNSIRIPVYQKRTVNITNYVYESSWIKGIDEIKVDLDLEVDSDNDWNTKNDNDVWDLLSIDHTAAYIKLELWKFDSVFVKNIGITLIDENANVWFKEIVLDVYTPSPQIDNYNDWSISWSIDEDLLEEPVSIYRFRWWVISQLENNLWEKSVLTDNQWNYDFEVSNTWTWVVLTYAEQELATINEITWKISFPINSILQTEVLSSNNELNNYWFPLILVKDAGLNIFYEYLRIKDVNKVNLVSTFEGIEDKWIYFKFTNMNTLNYYSVPETLTYNPGSISIYRDADVNKENLFTVFNDWRINTINSNYNLEYASYDDYIVIKLIDNIFSREIWRVLYKIDAEYIIK